MQQTQTIEGFRPSPQQTRLWLFQQHSHAYRAWGSIFIEGQLEIAPFQQALQTVLARHEIYRTCLHHVPGLALPVQVINPTPLSTCLYIDLKSFASQEQQRLLKKFAQAEKTLVIDREQGPLVYNTVFALSEHHHLWSIHLSALHCDPQTLQNLIGEIVHCYASPAEHTDDVLQYLQFSEWQNALLQEEREEGRAYWSEKDFLSFTTVSLPFKAKTKEQSPFDPDILTMPLCLDEDTRLGALLEKLQCTLAEFLLTCWYILLWKLTGHDEILVGLSTDGRIEDLQDIAGLLAKCLPLVCSLNSQQTVRKLLTQIQDAYDKLLLDHLYFNWEQLEGVAGPASFFAPFGFEWREQPDPLVGRAACFTLQQWESYFEPFHVKLVALHGSERLTIQFHFDRNLFDIQQIQCLAEQFALLVEQIIRQPEQRIGRLDILGATERELLLVQFHQHPTDFPRDLCLHQMFEQQVVRTPDAIAVEYKQAQFTYHQLNRRAHQLAQYLQHLGVGPETLVGIGLGQSIELVIGVLGILKAGGAYVPLDTTHPRERLVSLLESARISILLTDSHHQELLPTTQQVVCLDTDWTSIAQSKGEKDALVCTTVPTNLAYVIYTSGSTGQPKGVMVPHQGVVHYVDWSSKHYAVATGIGSAVHSPLSFDLTVTSFFPPLMVGRRLVLAPEAPGIEGLRQTLSMRNPLSLLKITPAHLDMLGQSLHPDELAQAAQTLVIGGEALHRESLSIWRQHAPRTRLINEYGPTETVVGCCIYEVPQDEELVGVVPIGRPIPNTQIYLLDAHLQLVPLGAPGELYVGGVGLGRGYLNRPDLTAERFLPNPFSKEPGTRLYKTGDVARYLSADGTLEYLGRLDNQIKLRGYRIELGEIEAVLRQHLQVQDCTILLQEEGLVSPQLIGYVVAEAASGLTPEDLSKMLRKYLPEPMVPSTFILLDTLPLTSNGKVDRRQLPRPEQVQERKAGTSADPRSALEEMLLEMWKELLTVPSLGIHDDFFAMGGHSLLATQVMARLQVMLQVALPVQILFEAPTVAALAQRVEQALRQGEELKMPPLVARERPEVLPLSFAQQRLWFLDQLELGNTTYVIPSALRMDGEIKAQALERSFQELIHRHESLRTTFEERDGQPMQVIHLAGPFTLPVIDLQGLREEQREQVARQLASQERQHPCDLTTGPLLRTYLLRLESQEHVLLQTLHHIITDGWSSQVLQRELVTLYQAFAAGQPSPLASLPIQYIDYALWQRAWLQGEVLQAQLSYWRSQLAGIVPLELPTDHPRPSVQTHRGARQVLQLSPILSEQLVALSGQQNVTLFMLLLAAFQILLARYTGQKEISVGTPIANRHHAEIERVIGFFVNTLVLRTDLSSNPTFLEVLRQVREVCLGAYAHQDVPFEKIVEELEPERDLSRSPLFQVMFVVQNTPPGQGELTGVSLEPFSTESQISKFDLTLSMVQREQGLGCWLEYNTNLFEADTITGMLSHWQRILEGVVDNPQDRVWDLPLLTAAEREQLLVQWNATQTNAPEDLCLHQLFEQQVERSPDVVALVFEEQQLTYEQLNGRANQLAHHLQVLGVGPEALVGLCMERSIEMVVGLLAVLKAGGAYLPLDPTYPAERLAYMIQDAHVWLLLTHHRLREYVPQKEDLQVISLDQDELFVGSKLLTNPESGVQLENLAYIIYTSGSTGSPKGVMISQRSLCNHMHWMQETFPLTEADRILQKTPFSFDASIWEFYAPLLAGARLIMAQPGGHQDGSYLVKAIAEQHITTVQLVPLLLEALLQELEWDTCSSLRHVFCGGEPLSNHLRNSFIAHHGAELHNLYGPTETCIDATSWTCTGRELSQVVPIGHPIFNTQLYVLDARLQLVPPAVAGELSISGVGLARGYLGRADLTAERFVPHPWSQQPGARLYRTGDLVRYRSDGNLEFVGRKDQQVKIRGYRIELGEIETMLQAHPDVQQGVVLVREDVPGDKRLVAYVVGSQDLTETGLRSFLQEQLPAYLIPSQILLMDAMPLTPNGKLDRKALPSPASVRSELEVAFISPRTPAEQVVAGIWAEILRMDHISLNDNFFELGGHSLRGVQVISRLRDAFQVKLPLRSLFERPTVEGLVSEIAQLRGGREIIEEIAEVIQEIEHLSEEDIKDILSN